MIVSSVSTNIERYYSLDRTLVTKHIINPITNKTEEEHLVYYVYNRVGEVTSSNHLGDFIDKTA
jgi:hypothetical protein